MSTARKPEVMIDCRMIEHSGIGVLLRQLLRHWADHAPAFSLKLIGNRQAMARLIPSQLDAEYLPFNAPIYGVGNLFSASPYKNADLFFSPHYSVPLFALRMKNVVMIQDLIHITYPPKLGTRLYMRIMLQLLRRFTTLTVTPSRYTKVQLQTLYGFTAHRVLTHPLGPGLSVETGVKSDSAFDTLKLPKAFFLCVGIDKPHKNFDLLLSSYCNLLKELGSSNNQIPDLVFAGIRPEGRSRIARQLTQLRLTERVHLIDPLPDSSVPLLYAGAKALIFPSLDEGFGFPVVEAMNAGTPVVCANLPPMNEIAGKAGITYDPDDEKGLQSLLSSLVQNEISLEQRTEKGKEQAAQFQWSRFNAELEETFLRALNEF